MSSKTSPQIVASLPNFSALLGETVHIYRHHFFALMGFAGWLALPLVLNVILRITFGDIPEIDTTLTILSGASLAIATWIYCHIVRFSAHVHTEGNPPAQLADIRRALLSTFIALGIYVVVVGIGSLAIVPGVLFGIWFAFAPMETALHERGVIASFSMSRELVRGRFFAVLGRLWGMHLLFILAYVGLVILIDLLLGYDLAHLDITAPLPVSMDIVLSVFEILAMPFIIIYLTLLYLGAKTS